MPHELDIPPGLLILPLTDPQPGPKDTFHFDAEAGTLTLEIPGFCKVVATGVRQLELYDPAQQGSRLQRRAYADQRGFPLRLLRSA